MRLRKLTAAVLALAMLCPLTAALPASAADAWRTEYQRLVKSKDTGGKTDYESTKYSLADIVGDGIPELMISPCELHIADVEVYTWYQGKAVFLGQMQQSGEMLFDATTGELISSCTSQGYTESQHYAFYCGALVQTLSLSDNNAANPPHYYKINGVAVSESEYDKYNSMLNSHKYVRYGRDYAASNMTPIQSFKVTNPVAELGNVNQDKAVNASDAARILIGAASYGAASRTGLSQAQETAGDVNGDHRINASDAAIVLIYAAAVGSGKTGARLQDYIR